MDDRIAKSEEDVRRLAPAAGLMRRWGGSGSVREFQRWSKELGAYWVRADEDDDWRVMMLAKWQGERERGTRTWGECGGCGECFFDKTISKYEVVGPIPEPA